MSVWKLRVGMEGYYLDQVAKGIEDYYTGRGEADGVWIGSGSDALGLAGQVGADDLRNLLAGRNPATGDELNGHTARARRVPGFDLTWSAPKSVSVLYALGDPRIQGEVIDACETAVTAAMGWLEREACFVRRGSNSRHPRAGTPSDEWGTRRHHGDGFAGAMFRHRTSRAGDPQLHWHVLVANTSRGPDGRWTALDATALYRAGRTPGAVFQSVMRHELTQRLGVEWGPIHQDMADIAGVPQHLLRVYSKRRVDIEHELALTGRDDRAGAQAATLATRTPKQLEHDGLVPGWITEANDHGWGPDQLDELLSSLTIPDPTRIERWTLPVVDPDTRRVSHVPVDRDVWIADVARELTGNDSTFTRHDITRTVTSRLGPGATIDRVETAAQQVLADPTIIPIPDDTRRPGTVIGGWEQRYTTLDQVRTETRLLDAITHSRTSNIGILPPAVVDTAIAAAGLSDDQATAIRRLAGAGHGIDVLVGKAGTGKTYMLNTLRHVYEQAGWHVIGAAPSARAARELEHGAHITSHTFPRHQRHLDRHPLSPTTLVVVDEAAMASTRDLDRLISGARAAGVKVLLVGDHHQLPAVGPGGLFAAAVDRLDDPATLTTNRRQHQVWEQAALDHLRNGNLHDAWTAYTTHDRIQLHYTDHDVNTSATKAWHADHAAGLDSIMLTGTRARARRLNTLARELLTTSGHLAAGADTTIGGRTFQSGDRVLLTRNDHHQTDTATGRQVSVDNGMIATITAIHPTGAVDLRLHGAGERTVRLDADYASRHLDHGYAVTTHKYQGATCDTAHAVGPDGFYREAIYTALSRARHGSWFHATTRDAARIGERHHATGTPNAAEHPDLDPASGLQTAMATSRAKTLAMTSVPDTEAINALAALPLRELTDRQNRFREVTRELIAAGYTDGTALTAVADRAEYTRRHLDVGRRVHAVDRDNVGTCAAIDDDAGAAEIRFTSATGRSTTRVLPWDQLRPIDHATPVVVPSAAEATFTRLRSVAANAAVSWSTTLARHRFMSSDDRTISRAITVRESRLAAQLAGDSPPWLTDWIGRRPTAASAAVVWDDTIRQIAVSADRSGATAPAREVLGQTISAVRRNRGWLARHAATLDADASLPAASVARHLRPAARHAVTPPSPVEAAPVVSAHPSWPHPFPSRAGGRPGLGRTSKL